MGSLRAELLIMRKYRGYWTLLALTLGVTVLLGYLLPYLSYRSEADSARRAKDLHDLLPGNAVALMLSALPFWLGMLALVFGALAFGGEYGWGTLKTTLMQQSSRLHLAAAKTVAIAIALAGTLLFVLLLALVCSLPIAAAEGASLRLPSAGEFFRGVGAGWLILIVWAMFGAFLAVVSRGTAFAIGVGIIYGLVLEGLVSGYREDLGLLGAVSHVFLRTSAYSLIEPFGPTVETGGPGGFSGPYIDVWAAALVTVGYIAAFAAGAALILRRRDVV